jgi:hypothetical protein
MSTSNSFPISDTSRVYISSDYINEIDIWVHDSLTRSKKLIAKYVGGRYTDIDKEFFALLKNKSYANKILNGIKCQNEKKPNEYEKRWICFKRSIMLQIRMIQRNGLQ